MLKLVKRPNSQVEGSIRRLCKRTLVGKWEFDSMAFLWALPWFISWSSYTSGVLKGTAHFLPNCRGFSKLIPLSIFTQCQPVTFVQINQPSWNLIWFPCLTFCKDIIHISEKSKKWERIRTTPNAHVPEAGLCVAHVLKNLSREWVLL